MDLINHMRIEGTSGQLILVSGPSGAGKTIWCRDQINHARSEGYTVGGVLSPGLYGDGEKVGIELLDLATGEKRLLGERRPKVLPNAPTRKWAMNDQAVAWGNLVLKSMGYYDLVVIDELGPLEFVYQRGFTEAFDLIRRRRFKTALVVVRPTLLVAAQEAWPEFIPRVHSLVDEC